MQFTGLRVKAASWPVPKRYLSGSRQRVRICTAGWRQVRHILFYGRIPGWRWMAEKGTTAQPTRVCPTIATIAIRFSAASIPGRWPIRAGRRRQNTGSRTCDRASETGRSPGIRRGFFDQLPQPVGAGSDGGAARAAGTSVATTPRYILIAVSTRRSWSISPGRPYTCSRMPW